MVQRWNRPWYIEEAQQFYSLCSSTLEKTAASNGIPLFHFVPFAHILNRKVPRVNTGQVRVTAPVHIYCLHVSRSLVLVRSLFLLENSPPQGPLRSSEYPVCNLRKYYGFAWELIHSCSSDGGQGVSKQRDLRISASQPLLFVHSFEAPYILTPIPGVMSPCQKAKADLNLGLAGLLLLYSRTMAAS